MVTKTISKLHFTDLEPGRFEMMTMLMIYRMRRWEKINHFGAAGTDDGIDIEAVELLENGERVTYHFQCKRYEKLTKTQLKNIVMDYKNKNQILADYYYIVCGCNISKTAYEEFEKACADAKIKNGIIWNASYIEAALYSEHHDILFTFFGVDVNEERKETIALIRRNTAFKEKIHRDFEKTNLLPEEIREIQKGKCWKKFKYADVLIHSIYDKSYPDNTSGKSGWFRAEVYNWYHNGLEVATSRGGAMARIKWPKCGKTINSKNPSDFDIIEIKIDEFGQIPYENIKDYDMDGDEYYRCPHLFCDYPCGTNPYEKIVYRLDNGYPIDNKMIVEIY